MNAIGSGVGPVSRWWRSRDGLRLHALDYSGAEGDTRLPVVCIHGLTRNARDFGEVAPYIAAMGRRVLCLDVRGRGQSEYDPKPMNYTPLAYSRDVVDLFQQAGIRRAVFVGTSMGGLITMTLAALHRSLIAAAVLNDVGPEISIVGVSRIARYTGQPVEIETWDDAAAYCRRINEAVFPNNTDADWLEFARRTFRDGPKGRPVLDYDPDIAAPIRAAGPKAVMVKLWPLYRRLARSRPTLLVRGATSDLLDAGVAEKMRKVAPTLRYVEVPGVGHAPMLTEPEAKSAICEFLSELP